MSGPMPGYTYTGASTEPTLELTFTMSPVRTPRSAAALGLTSTQLSHMTVVMVSATSCIQGRLAWRPSARSKEG